MTLRVEDIKRLKWEILEVYNIAIETGDEDLEGFTNEVIEKVFRAETDGDEIYKENWWCENRAEKILLFQKLVAVVHFSDKKTEDDREICENGDFSSYIFPRISFNRIIFKNETNFFYTKFKDEIIFLEVIFENKVDFFDTSFTNYIGFFCSEFKKNACFISTTFNKEIGFFTVNFAEWVDFFHAIFAEWIIFRGTTFMDGVDFWGATIQKNLTFTKVSFFKKQKIILHNSNIFEFNLETKNYENIILAIYESKIEKFLCDNLNLKNIQLYSYIKNLSDINQIKEMLEFYKTRECQDSFDEIKPENLLENQIECLCIYLHECRKMQKVFKELNIFEADDEYYAKIMETQTRLAWLEAQRDLQESQITKWNYLYKSAILHDLKKWVYGKMFGWGVHLWNILWTTLGTILLFFMTYSSITHSFTYQAKDGIWYTFFLAVKGFFDVLSPDSNEIVNFTLRYIYAFEHIIWVFIITIFVAMISRKFMRM